MAGLPEGAQHVCTFVFHFGFDSDDMSVYVHRGEQNDEMWAACAALRRTPQVKAAAPMSGTIEEAAHRLFPVLLRSILGYGGGPTRFESAGLVDEDTYNAEMAALDAWLDHRQERARKQAEETRRQAQERAVRTPIVDLADGLGLSAEPALEPLGGWRAQCPGTNHQLQLDATKGLFYCGYCRRGGGRLQAEGCLARAGRAAPVRRALLWKNVGSVLPCRPRPCRLPARISFST